MSKYIIYSVLKNEGDPQNIIGTVRTVRFPKTLRPRTTRAQFEIIVSFLEKYGTYQYRGKTSVMRLHYNKHWAELTRLLNSSPDCVAPKTTFLWKKSWHDLRLLTKRKYDKLMDTLHDRTAAIEQLSPMEKRVLAILQGTVEGNIKECVFQFGSQESTITHNEELVTPTEELETNRVEAPLPVNEEKTVEETQIEPPQTQAPSDPPEDADVEIMTPKVEQTEVIELDELPEPEDLGLDRASTASSSSSSICNVLRHQEHTPRNTPKRQRSNSKDPTNSKIKHSRPDNTLENCMGISHSEEEWRKYFIENELREVELEKERLRLREIELVGQIRLQEVVGKAIDSLHKIISTQLSD